MNSELAPVWVNGHWRNSQSEASFRAENPATGEKLPAVYPVSSREEVLDALNAGAEAADALNSTEPERIALFLEQFARAIEQRRVDLVEIAHLETGLAKTPRLNDAELPRTVDQLRQAATAARSGSWRRPVRDSARQIHSGRAPLGGPVVVMGPNNFPFAFNSAAGGDMASALAAHNPIIAKANTGHPGTTRLFAEIASEALASTGLHPATIQLLYRTSKESGFELVAHPFVGATAFTGSREAGLKLKAAADAVGKPIYLEMSSINPVVLLGGALRERGPKLAEDFFASCTMGAGQFCTNPGLLLIPHTAEGGAFIQKAKELFGRGAPGVLLGAGVRDRLVEAVKRLRDSGAELLCGGDVEIGPGYRFQNTLLHVTAQRFLLSPNELQQEAFGPVALLVSASDPEEMAEVVSKLEGNLTGTIYTHTGHEDDEAYGIVEPFLRKRVGRLLNNKMPTGVAVSPAMNHGGPFPATGHPGFTAVGMPASIERFTALHSYDGVEEARLPKWLRT